MLPEYIGIGQVYDLPENQPKPEEEKPPVFFLGLDLGQQSDYTAIVIIERIEAEDKPDYHLRHLERVELGTPYPDIVSQVSSLMDDEALKGHCDLIVDATGVGQPVVDLLEQAKLRPIAVTITGGDKVHRESNYSYRIPKRDLIQTLVVCFQTDRLKIARSLPGTQMLVDELMNFRVKINLTGHDRYEAWREGAHDDLVLASALAVWYGESGYHHDWKFIRV